MGRFTQKELEEKIYGLEESYNKLSDMATTDSELLHTATIGLLIVQYSTLLELRILNDTNEFKYHEELVRRRDGY